MTLIIILFGILMAGSGLVLMVRPSLIIDFIEVRDESAWLYAFGIGVRLLLGLLLVQLADQSRYPLVVEILGWISLAAALFLAVLGFSRFTRFMRWIMEKTKPWSRVAGLFAVAFGAFLVYAFV